MLITVTHHVEEVSIFTGQTSDMIESILIILQSLNID